MKAIVIILMLLMVPVVMAEDIEVFSFKAYVNGKQITDDIDEGDFTLEKGSTLEIQLRLENTYTENKEVTIEGILYDISGDIERSETVTIQNDDREVVVFEYFIPSSTSEGIYDYVLSYEWGDRKVTREYDVLVQQPVEDVEEFWKNISLTCLEEKDVNLEIKKQLENQSSRCILLEHENGKLQQQVDELEEYKDKYNVECKNVDEAHQECEAEKKAMFSLSQVEARENAAAREARDIEKDKSNQTLFTVLIGGGVYLYMKRKKENLGGKGEGESTHGATWA